MVRSYTNTKNACKKTNITCNRYILSHTLRLCYVFLGQSAPPTSPPPRLTALQPVSAQLYCLIYIYIYICFQLFRFVVGHSFCYQLLWGLCCLKMDVELSLSYDMTWYVMSAMVWNDITRTSISPPQPRIADVFEHQMSTTRVTHFCHWAPRCDICIVTPTKTYVRL